MMQAGTSLTISEEDIEWAKPKDAKKAGFDFVAQLDRMTKDTQHRQSAATAGLKLADFEPMTGLRDRKAEDPCDGPLREAKTLIQRKQFEQAMRPLLETLQQRPRHAEATYLLAYCLAHHDPPEPAYDERALRLLLMLNRMQVGNTAQTPVRALRGFIRGRRSSHILAQNLALLIRRRFDQSIALLRHEIQMDPEMGLYYYMLGGAMLMAERLVEAHEAISLGLQVGTAEYQAVLRDLQTEVERRVAFRDLDPVRQHYRRGGYAQVRAALKDVPTHCRQTRLFTLFQDYLAQLGGTTGPSGLFKSRSKTPGEVTLSGDGEDLDTLGFFLVGDELSQARALMNGGGLAQARQAENLLAHALEQAPFFAFAHYLYASAIFVRLREEIQSGRPPSVETVEEDLQRAREHIRAAEADPGIPNVALAAKVIDKTLTIFAQVREEHQKRLEEAQHINAAIDEYRRIMDSVRGGLKDVEDLQRVRQSVEELRRQVPNLTRITTSAEGKEAVARLAQALNARLSELDGVQRDAEREEEAARPVNDAIQEYQSIMEAAQSGVRGVEDYERVRDRLQTLERRLPSVALNVGDTEGKKAVRDLEQAVTAGLRELDRVKNELGHVDMVRRHYEAFGKQMENLERHPVSDFSQMAEAGLSFESLRRSVRADRNRLSRGPSRDALDKLLTQLDLVLERLLR